MALNERARKAVVTALNAEFDAGEVSAILSAMDRDNTLSLPQKATIPNFDLYIPGQWYDAAFQGTVTPTTYVGVANALDVAPFFVGNDLIVNNLSVGVVTGVASANVHIVIYEAGENYLPNNKVYESGDLSAATSTTVVGTDVNFQFLGGKLYWLGVHNSSTATLRGIRDYASISLGLNANTSASANNMILRKSVAFGSAPANWTFSAAELTNIAPPSVRFKVA